MSKLNLKRIDLWSICLKFIVIIITIFFICIIGYFFILRTTLEKKEKIYLDFQSFKKELNNQLEIASKYSICQEKIKNIKIKFDIHSNGIDRIILNILNGQFFPFLEINKIHILAIKKDFLNSLQVESDFSSINNNIFNFIYQISRLNKFILIEQFSWIFFNDLSRKQQQNIIFLFKVSLPYFNSKNLILALSKINKNAKPLPKNSNLTKYPLNKIRMLGFISLGKYQNWGFVALPNKQICKLKFGDHLGLEQGIVIGTYAHEILIQNNNLGKIIKLSMDERKFPDVKNYAQ